MLVYVDDIDIIGLKHRIVSSIFSNLTKEARRMSLLVNEGKTKYLLSSNEQTTHSQLDSHVIVDNHDFEDVDNFIYVGTNINSLSNQMHNALLPTVDTLD